MIHKYTLFGYNIALDVESGSVHVLSDVAQNMLNYLEMTLEKNKNGVLPEECPADLRYSLAKYESSDVKEAYAEICGLHKNNKLFSPQAPFDKFGQKEGFVGVPLKALCLNISHDCNLACRYCFAGKSGYNLEKKLMSGETALNAIEFLFKNSHNRKNLEVDFFGGEPLLNFDIIKNTVEKTRELEKKYNKNVRFTLTTNGTLLDDGKIDFINNNISNIVLSLDGLPETNDNMRGEKTYEKTIPLYQKLIAGRTGEYRDYYIRGTFTRRNLNFSRDILHMRELGFVNLSVEPVIADENKDYAIKKEDLPVIFKEYETLAREIIKRRRKNNQDEFNFFHFNIDLENAPCVYKRIKGCGAGSEYLSITPNGDVYPCHQFVGIEKYKLGNINENIKPNQDITHEFYRNNIITNKYCKDCWAKYFCGGGCAANNYIYNKNIYEPDKIACELEKKRVECAIAIKAALI